MGLWRHASFSPQEPGFKMMELYIETLTGTVFELRVSPYETVQDVKARIQKLEGIPMSQQHLIWQAQELDDDYSLHDYAIQDGATLKLVLTMRGGPINTRRVPVEDAASLREMAEYFSAAAAAESGGREEMSHSSNRPVTVIVYQNGDQVNFFRVVDRDSSAASPTAESLSGASMYNLYDDDDVEDVEGLREKLEDNDKTKGKMKLLRSKMENMVITKKPKSQNAVVASTSNKSSKNHTPTTSQPNSGRGLKKPLIPAPQLIPHPPTSSRPLSMSRLSRRFPSAATPSPTTPSILNRNPCLPPVGGSVGSQDPQDSAAQRFAQMLKEKEEAKNNNTGSYTSYTTTSANFPATSESSSSSSSNSTANLNHLNRMMKLEEQKSRLMGPLTSVKEDEPGDETHAPPNAYTPLPSSSHTPWDPMAPDLKTQQEVLEALLRQAHSVRSPRRWEYSSDVLLRESADRKVSNGNNGKGQNDKDNNLDASSSSQQQQHRPDSTTSTSKAPLPRASGIERLWSESSDIQTPSAPPSASDYSRYILPPPLFPPPSQQSTSSYLPSTSTTTTNTTINPATTTQSTSTTTTAMAPSAKRQISLDSFSELIAKPSTSTTTSAAKQRERERKNGASSGRGVILESLNLHEVRKMSGMLTNYVQQKSATKSRATPTATSISGGKEGRRTPDGRLLSGRARLGSAGGGRASPRLAPMKHKKKTTKRCFLCGKKTGLATSYQCRCGENFCATHRYAESHSCTFDYKTEGRKILQQSNPVVTAPKLPKI